MIVPQQLYNINFYKSQNFYGSYKGMHYRIEKAEETDTVSPDTSLPETAETGAAAPADPRTIFRVAVWPGPYNFASTPSEKIEFFTFPFCPESIEEICDFLNQKWDADYSRP